MRYRFLLLVLILAVPALTASAQSGAARLRVMTFNIRYDNPRDGENAWPNRKEMVAGMIRFHGADLVGVQEALRRQLDDLATLLPEYAWYGVGRDDGKDKGEFSAIFYRRDRFQVLEGGTFWLSETPDTPGSKNWDAAITRIATWCKFRDRTAKRDFFHFNTHFDHVGVEARKQSALLLRTRMAKMAGNSRVILTGDFNCRQTDAPYLAITSESGDGRPLRDARNLSQFGHHGPTSTFNGFKALGPPESRIDYIFLGDGWRVRLHGTLADTFDGRFPSDHLPVIAEIE
ncbi:MAG: endonuclease/exonuclease/phosphatase family protein [Acidobacteria bacterium]|nr:endonuclease/exonuclease/phosphatase family protein [Acidobacteriota bacterium]MCW5967400.1 endonuclease/exonuclease/phosphatase family protein [Blastocatellales bacterium]